MSRNHASTAWHFVLAIHFLSVFFLMCNSAFAEEKTESGDKIKELKEKRLVLLVNLHESTLKLYMQGQPKITLDQVHQTKVDLFAARLDLAETKEDRIKVCEEAVKDAEAWEKIAGEMVEKALASPIEGVKAQAYVLETRIALEKAKAAK